MMVVKAPDVGWIWGAKCSLELVLWIRSWCLLMDWSLPSLASQPCTLTVKHKQTAENFQGLKYCKILGQFCPNLGSNWSQMVKRGRTCKARDWGHLTWVDGGQEERKLEHKSRDRCRIGTRASSAESFGNRVGNFSLSRSVTRGWHVPRLGVTFFRLPALTLLPGLLHLFPDLCILPRAPDLLAYIACD